MKIAIIGGGAAGCFAAIEIKRRQPNAEVTVYERSKKLLAKVAVTGGGRCNITNSFEHVKSMESIYPRGAKLMKRLLMDFNHDDTCRWFEKEGVRFVTQDDGCIFPKSQDAMEIVTTLTRAMHDIGVKMKTSHHVNNIKFTVDDNSQKHFEITFSHTANIKTRADKVLVATGGSPQAKKLEFLDSMKLEMTKPVASLFSMCIPDKNITKLMGIVVDDVIVGIAGTKLRASGALLITHWGMSGPAILKLSSYGARVLHNANYCAPVTVNWLGNMDKDEVTDFIYNTIVKNGRKQLQNIYPEQLNSRLWIHLLSKCNVRHDMRWAELGTKSINKIIAILTNDTYHINGKNRFKEEFVTCGGIALSNVKPSTLECRSCPGLFFAGEVLDVDAITGGFNLQAAWTMAHTTAEAISKT